MGSPWERYKHDSRRSQHPALKYGYTSGAMPDTYGSKTQEQAAQSVLDQQIAADKLEMAKQENDPMFLAAGRTADKVVAQGKDSFYDLTGNEQGRREVAAEQADRDSEYAYLQQAAPKRTFAGEAAPYFSIPLGAGAKAASLPTKVMGKTAERLPIVKALAPGLEKTTQAIASSPAVDALTVGGATGAAHYDSNATAGASGAVLGNMAAKLFARGVTPFSSNMNETMAQRLRAGKDMGMKQTPGQATGNKALQKFEASLESNPVTSKVIDRVKDHNQKILNQKVGKAIGEEVEEVTESVLGRAQERISNVFKAVKNIGEIKVDKKTFDDALLKIAEDADGLADSAVLDNELVSRAIKAFSSGKPDSAVLRTLSSKLGTKSNTLMTSPSGDRELGLALYRVKDLVDDGIETALTGAEKQAFAKARREYRNLMNITSRETAINKGTGDVNARSMSSALGKKERGAMVFGKDVSDPATREMIAALKYGDSFKPIVGDSGTGTRGFTGQVMGMGTLGAGLGLMSGGDATSAGSGMIGLPLLAMALSRGGANAYMSKPAQLYLANKLIPDTLRNQLGQATGRIGASSVPGLDISRYFPEY